VRRLQVLSDHNFVVRSMSDTIVFNDLRFGQMGEPSPDKPFVFAYLLVPTNGDLRVELIPPGPPRGEDLGTLLNELWERVKGE